MRMRICLPSAICVRVTLIHNPGAGSTGENDAVQLEKLLGRAGHKVRYRSSKERGWKRALRKPADLVVVAGGDGTVGRVIRRMVGLGVPVTLDRKSTRLNSSHQIISYAVFCLKKK